MAIVNLPPHGISLQEIERLALLQALTQCGWIQKDAALFLKCSARVMNYKIRLHRIPHPSGSWKIKAQRWDKPVTSVPISAGIWTRRQQRGVPGGAKLTPSDVEGIHEAAAALPGLSNYKQAHAIAHRSKGLLGSWQRIRSVLTGDSWRRLHPLLGGTPTSEELESHGR